MYHGSIAKSGNLLYYSALDHDNTNDRAHLILTRAGLLLLKIMNKEVCSINHTMHHAPRKSEAAIQNCTFCQI